MSRQLLHWFLGNLASKTKSDIWFAPQLVLSFRQGIPKDFQLQRLNQITKIPHVSFGILVPEKKHLGKQFDHLDFLLRDRCFPLFV